MKRRLTPQLRENQAFLRAVLHSEKARVLGMNLSLMIFLGFFTFRSMLTREMPLLVILIGWGLLGLLVASELAIYTYIRRCVHVLGQAPTIFQRISVLIESAIPTAALLFMQTSDAAASFRTLSAPAILLYLVFIIFSTLRLDPLMCLMAGLTSLMGYLGLVTYTYHHYAPAPEELGLPGMSTYVTFSAMILLGGLAAMTVARQIRLQVVAAIGEAQARQKLEEELSLARSIQQGLLPKAPPDLGAYDIAGFTRPADQTGGDYYDWHCGTDGRVFFTLADVAGHGIGPALVTANCHAYGHAILPWSQNLESAMTRINELLAGDLPDDRFVTFAAAVLDPAQHTLRWLSAGHGPLLLYRHADRSLTELLPQGIPMGIAPDTDYGPAAQFQMGPGDMFVLLTDGFFEAASTDKELFGLQRVKDLLSRHADAPAHEIIAALVRAVDAHKASAPQADDLTALVIKRR